MEINCDIRNGSVNCKIEFKMVDKKVRANYEADNFRIRRENRKVLIIKLVTIKCDQ